MINLNMHEGSALLLYDPNDKDWAVFVPDSRALGLTYPPDELR